jgi:hypothetical protein
VDLNTDFGATTPDGESIFSKPFGEMTSYETKLGQLVVKFLFEPDKPYGKSHIMASMSQNYFTDMANYLMKRLLAPEDIVPSIVTEEETVWNNIKANLPKDTLVKYLEKKENLDMYIEQLTRDARMAWNQEHKFRKALTETPFSFCYQVAIDSFPRKKSEDSNVVNSGVTPERKGVLSFYIEHRAETPPSPPATPDRDLIPEDKKQDVNGNDKLVVPKGKRKKRKKSQDERDLEKLRQSLQIDVANEGVIFEKEFPDETTEFFEQLNNWFHSAISNRAAAIEKIRSGNLNLYQ